jgi:hypothetical protein
MSIKNRLAELGFLRPVAVALLALGPLLAARGRLAAEEAKEPVAPAQKGDEFHVPAERGYTIVDSVRDSLRFTLEKTLRRDEKGHLVSISSFVNPEGEIMGWHDFGNLEGPGWAANAVGGAHEIFSFGRFLGKKDWTEEALSILDHVLDCGFIDEETGFIKGYRITEHGLATTESGRRGDPFCLNYKHGSDWFCRLSAPLLRRRPRRGPSGGSGSAHRRAVRRVAPPEGPRGGQRVVPAPHHRRGRDLQAIARRRK